MSLFRGMHGERGRTGDHGQEGGVGPAGPQGIPGSSDPDEFEREVARVVGEALGERRHWLFNRQMMTIFLFVVAASLVLFYVLDRRFAEFRQNSYENCSHINEGNRIVNELLEARRTDPGIRLPITTCAR